LLRRELQTCFPLLAWRPLGLSCPCLALTCARRDGLGRVERGPGESAMLAIRPTARQRGPPPLPHSTPGHGSTSRSRCPPPLPLPLPLPLPSRTQARRRPGPAARRGPVAATAADPVRAALPLGPRSSPTRARLMRSSAPTGGAARPGSESKGIGGTGVEWGQGCAQERLMSLAGRVGRRRPLA
jgi:hypothetical protein